MGCGRSEDEPRLRYIYVVNIKGKYDDVEGERGQKCQKLRLRHL